MKNSPLRIFALCCCISFAGCEPQVISDAKEALRHGAKDPDSVQFRDVKVCGADSQVVMGEYNAKNGYGAYNGYEPFYYSDYRIAFSSDSQFQTMMARCFGPEIMKKVDAEVSSMNPSEITPNANAAPTSSHKVKHKFPYVAPDGVDIRNAADEANWKKYGTTDPNGGE
jgi:hypothetical protein